MPQCGGNIGMGLLRIVTKDVISQVCSNKIFIWCETEVWHEAVVSYSLFEEALCSLAIEVGTCFQTDLQHAYVCVRNAST